MNRLDDMAAIEWRLGALVFYLNKKLKLLAVLTRCKKNFITGVTSGWVVSVVSVVGNVVPKVDIVEFSK